MTSTGFIHDDFLLENKYAIELYHGHAKKMPIIDYHNHLSPKEIAENSSYKNLTQVWINGDHYKWRGMRTLGIKEEFITGNASDAEKFKKWAETVPYTMRNPLYHWTHLELKRYFDIDALLSPKSAIGIYEHTKELLATPDYSCRGLLKKMNVEFLCTTEDPTDDLQYHQQLSENSFRTKVSTAFRPDKALLIQGDGFNTYLDSLEVSSGISINSYQNLCDALEGRIEFFHKNGCRISDHGLPYIPFSDYTEAEVMTIFGNRRQGKEISDIDATKFQTAVLIFLAKKYHALKWVQQFHLGPLRNNNTRMFRLLGPDTGWDSIGDWPQAENLSNFLDALDRTDALAKTIIYNLNPRDNEVMAAMVGNFNDGSIKGKVQFGSGWWFLDQKDGMEKQMNALSNIGLISCFVGMLTDSRSFLSFPRHEYFRRILCNLFGKEIANGQLPNDMTWIGKLVEDICYNNAKEYFDF